MGQWVFSFGEGQLVRDSDALVPKRVITQISTHLGVSGCLQKIAAYHHGMRRFFLGCLTARESPTLATYSQLSPCSQPQTLTPVEQSKVQPKCVQMLPAILGLPLRQGNEEPRLSRFFGFRIQ